MSEATRIELNDTPDGFGFLYGKLICGEDERRLDVLPPQDHWRGDMALSGYEPHGNDWVVDADGEEIARVANREDFNSREVVEMLGSKHLRIT